MYNSFYNNLNLYYNLDHIDLYSGLLLRYHYIYTFIILTFIHIEIIQCNSYDIGISSYIYLICSVYFTIMISMTSYWYDDIFYFHFFWWQIIMMLSILSCKFIMIGSFRWYLDGELINVIKLLHMNVVHLY